MRTEAPLTSSYATENCLQSYEFTPQSSYHITVKSILILSYFEDVIDNVPPTIFLVVYMVSVVLALYVYM
jgi:hypothetical protein